MSLTLTGNNILKDETNHDHFKMHAKSMLSYSYVMYIQK